MGLMDKVKAQATVLADKAQTGMQQGQTKLQELQTGRQADHLLRALGAYVFLSERGRSQPDAESKMAGIMSQLDALEAGGVAVAVSGDPTTGGPEGAGPDARGEAGRGTASPPPPDASPPQSGGTIPKSGGGLPGQ